MITIDDRMGSMELLPLFPKGMAISGRLQFGDASWLGRGPDEVPTPVGVERKKIMDLVDCLITGRLSGHQIPGLKNSYDIVYLIVEGLWRPSPKSGLLERSTHGKWVPLSIGPRTFMAREIYNYLNSLSLLTGIFIWFTAFPQETVYLIQSLYHWWVDKPFSAHGSHLKPHIPAVTLNVSKKSVVQRVAMDLPGIGPEKARLISKRFPTVMEMVLATENEWQEIDGIGKILSKRIVNLLQEGE